VIARGIIRHEATTATGYSIRATLEPMPDGTLRVIEWRRKMPHWETYRRDPREVGRTIAPAQLGIATAQARLFGAVAPTGRRVRRGRV